MRIICEDYLIEFDDIKKTLLINKNNKIKLIDNLLMKCITPLESVLLEFVKQINSKEVKNKNIQLAVEVTKILGAI